MVCYAPICHAVCHAAVVVRVAAELLHARPTVVLGKPHPDIASHLAGGHYVIKCQFFW